MQEGEGSISHRTSSRWPASPKRTSSTAASLTNGEAS
uniref:Psy3 n=1 Tax=Arundo donax TaxID=35708 RepID=A0A0A9B9D1_ARUDO